MNKKKIKYGYFNNYNILLLRYYYFFYNDIIYKIPFPIFLYNRMEISTSSKSKSRFYLPGIEINYF